MESSDGFGFRLRFIGKTMNFNLDFSTNIGTTTTSTVTLTTHNITTTSSTIIFYIFIF